MTDIIQGVGLPFLACLAMTGILSYLGIHVLKREVIFIDIALAQAAAVGAIVAHLAFEAHGDSALAYACAFGFVLLMAAFYSLVRSGIVQIPLEAIIGVSYAIAAAAALFLLGVAPGGHVHVHEMLAGSILWTAWSDILLCVLVFSVAGLCFYFLRKPVDRISDDYAGGLRGGMRVVLWDLLFYALLGIVITLAVRIAGVVVVFAFLIIPATTSALFTASVKRRLIIAWASGAVASFLGILFAYELDFSVGPSVALFLGLALVAAALWRTWHAWRRSTVA